MSSQAASREDGRRLSLRTLMIASVASATAAVVTSLFWKGGTPIAAAVTPVIVAVVSELLHRPAEKIATRFTTETDALPAEAAGAGAPPPRGRRREEPPAREIPTAQRERTAAREDRLRSLSATKASPNGGSRPVDADMKVYSAPPRRPRLRFKLIAATAAAAFVIAAAILTLPELIAGQSFGQSDRGTTLFGGSSGGGSDQGTEPEQETEAQPQTPAPDQPDQGQSTEEQTTPTEPPAEDPEAQPPATPAPAPAPREAAPGEPAP